MFIYLLRVAVHQVYIEYYTYKQMDGPFLPFTDPPLNMKLY